MTLKNIRRPGMAAFLLYLGVSFIFAGAMSGCADKKDSLKDEEEGTVEGFEEFDEYYAVNPTGINEVPGLPGIKADDEILLEAQQYLALLTPAEKVNQMSGKTEFDLTYMFDQYDNEERGIDGFYYLDGPRGARWIQDAAPYGTTVFPASVTRANSWSPELETELGKIAGDETRALGANVNLAPCMNQVTHPRHGRSQETYGEDSHLLGVMGGAYVKGVQYETAGKNPIGACVKHYAANNIENTRMQVNVNVDERTLREVYLRHFKRAIQESNPAMVMGSYNQVNGFYSCMNKPLLKGFLRDEWYWSGMVISDWFATGSTVESLEATLDVEMPISMVNDWFPNIIYGTSLQTAIDNGTADIELVNQSVLRILYQKVRLGMMDYDTEQQDTSVLQSDPSMQTVLESARKGIVLLKNESILPLDKTNLSNGIVMLGEYANKKILGDQGSSDAHPVEANESDALVKNCYEGIADVLGAGNVQAFVDEAADTGNAVSSADVVIVVVGTIPRSLWTGAGEEGEGYDRESLALPQRDLDNIAYATENNDNVIVVAQIGGPFLVKNWISDVKGLIWGGFMGMKGGTALAEIIFGDVNPSGKTCQSFPVNETDLPAFDNESEEVTYQYYHGYRYLDKQGTAPQYYFGHGLSYTTYSYSNLQVAGVDEDTLEVTVSVDVQNTGDIDGEEVVQLYVGFDNTKVADSIGRPKKELKAFDRVALSAGEKKTVTLTIDPEDLTYWNAEVGKMILEKMEYQLYVGASSDPADLLTGAFTID